jgi:hypothetical protein
VRESVGLSSFSPCHSDLGLYVCYSLFLIYVCGSYSLSHLHFCFSLAAQVGSSFNLLIFCCRQIPLLGRKPRCRLPDLFLSRALVLCAGLLVPSFACDFCCRLKLISHWVLGPHFVSHRSGRPVLFSRVAVLVTRSVFLLGFLILTGHGLSVCR